MRKNLTWKYDGAARAGTARARAARSWVYHGSVGRWRRCGPGPGRGPSGRGPPGRGPPGRLAIEVVCNLPRVNGRSAGADAVPVAAAAAIRAHLLLRLVGHLLVDLLALLLGRHPADGALDEVAVGPLRGAPPDAPAGPLWRRVLARGEAPLLRDLRAVGAAGDLVAVLVGLPAALLALLLPRVLLRLLPALRRVDGLARGRVVHPHLAALAVLLPVLLALLARAVLADLLVPEWSRESSHELTILSLDKSHANAGWLDNLVCTNKSNSFYSNDKKWGEISVPGVVDRLVGVPALLPPLGVALFHVRRDAERVDVDLPAFRIELLAVLDAFGQGDVLLVRYSQSTGETRLATGRNCDKYCNL